MTTVLERARGSLRLPENWEAYSVTRLKTVTRQQFIYGPIHCSICEEYLEPGERYRLVLAHAKGVVNSDLLAYSVHDTCLKAQSKGKASRAPFQEHGPQTSTLSK